MHPDGFFVFIRKKRADRHSVTDQVQLFRAGKSANLGFSVRQTLEIEEIMLLAVCGHPVNADVEADELFIL